MELRTPHEVLLAEKERLEQVRGKVVREIGLAKRSRDEASKAADTFIAQSQADLDQLDRAVLAFNWWIRKTAKGV